MAQQKAKPQELHLDSRLDQSIDISLRRVVYGTLAGGAAAVLLFRGNAARAAAIGFGAGSGAGSAYTECQRELHQLFTGK